MNIAWITVTGVYGTCLRYHVNKNFPLFAILNSVFQTPIIECTQKAMYSTSKMQLLTTVVTLSVPAQRTHTSKKQRCVWNVVFHGYWILCAGRSKQTDIFTAYMYVTTALKFTMKWGVRQYIFIFFMCICVYLD